MSKIVFIGDSITEYMPYIYKGSIGNPNDEVQYRGIENIGVGDYMKYCWPRRVNEGADTYILLIGINNICRPDCDDDNRETLTDLEEKLKEFISEIVKSTPARLIVQSIYPTKYLNSRDAIILINNKLQRFCQDIGVEYLDIYSLLKDENELLDSKYSDDGIHPNNAGYFVVAEAINKQLGLEPSKRLNFEKK